MGIVEKIILRWRRKGTGLRGFKSEALTEGSSVQNSSSKDDDYDFLKEGRKQSEERMKKALARVKSMVQYPEARNQYRRLLNVVTEIQETKVIHPSWYETIASALLLSKSKSITLIMILIMGLPEKSVINCQVRIFDSLTLVCA